MKKILCFFIVSFSLVFVPTLMADEKNDADFVLKEATSVILNLLRDKKMDEEERRTKVLEVVKSIFDFTLMGKLTLGRKNWPKFTNDEKKVFIRLYTQQLSNTYYEKIKFFSYDKIKFEKSKKVKKKIYILTKVFPKDKKLEILYKLYKTKDNWKIYDAEIQGVSVISSFRAQYAQFLSKGSVSDFLKKMQEKG